MDLEVLGSIDEAQHGSVTLEAEEAASKILKDLAEEEDQQQESSADQPGDGKPRSSDSTKPPHGAKDMPLVDPPEFGDRVQDIFCENPHWILEPSPRFFRTRQVILSMLLCTRST